jgi:hypothetical protein
MEKQAFALVKELKAFRDYIFHSKLITFVPHVVVKYILEYQDCDRRRGKWITKIQEYELKIKPTNLTKGQGLVKLMDESNYKAMGINIVSSPSHDTRENPYKFFQLEGETPHEHSQKVKEFS